MNLLAYFNTTTKTEEVSRARAAVETVQAKGAELEAAVSRLGEIVQSNIEMTINRTLAENRRVTGRPRRYD